LWRRIHIANTRRSPVSGTRGEAIITCILRLGVRKEVVEDDDDDGKEEAAAGMSSRLSSEWTQQMFLHR
jgi:hypothetical protein